MADLIERISRTAGSVSERGKTWLETAKLRNELEQVERQRSEVVHALGERAYQQMRAGGLSASELAPAFKQIQELDQRTSLLGQQIAALEAPTSGQQDCPACGHANAPGDSFCVACGNRVDAPAPSVPTCAACGVEMKPEARFCVSCGTPVAQAAR